MKTSDIIMAIALIFFGILFLLDNIGLVSFHLGYTWPVFIILTGSVFWIAFFKTREKYGLILPGTIFSIYGLMFLICSLTYWHYMKYLWPGFLIAPGLGFFFLYYFGNRKNGHLIAAGIFSGLGLLFIFAIADIIILWPVLLILVGLYLIFKDKIKNKEKI
jgi:hypothetical protein